MTRKYFRNKETNEQFILVDEIRNGIILTKFDPKDGMMFGNSNYKLFVTKDQLDADYSKLDFRIDIGEKEKLILASTLRGVIDTMRNYGVIEESVTELRGLQTDIARELSHDEDFDLEKSMTDDEWFEVSQCESAFYFIKGLVPVIKKSIAQLRE